MFQYTGKSFVLHFLQRILKKILVNISQEIVNTIIRGVVHVGKTMFSSQKHRNKTRPSMDIIPSM